MWKITLLMSSTFCKVNVGGIFLLTPIRVKTGGRNEKFQNF